MDIPPTAPLARAGDQSLTLAELFRWLQQRGRLLPLLREAAAEQVSVRAARDAGLSVSDADLQRAADHFRRRHGLTSVEATRRWLAAAGLSAGDFEGALERDLLVERFKDHLAAEQSAAHFASNRDRYARAYLWQIVVGDEGLARELLAQLTEEGRDFAVLAREHSLELASARAGGELGVLLRCQLPDPFSAAVFAAREGDVVGPLPGPGGFYLLQVERLLPAELDETTRAVLRRELFDAWLQQRLAGLQLDLAPREGGDGAG